MNSSLKQQLYLLLAWLIALIAMLVTLYMGEMMNLPICHLCWYQRICFYPLVLILGIAAYRNDKNAVLYAIPLASLGFLFAFYQYLQQMIPGFAPIGLCGIGADCSQTHMLLLGFITLPLLSLFAASLMIAALILAWKAS